MDFGLGIKLSETTLNLRLFLGEDEKKMFIFGKLCEDKGGSLMARTFHLSLSFLGPWTEQWHRHTTLDEILK